MLFDSATMTIQNSTISDNFASFSGGVSNSGMMTITNSTIANNVVSLGGGISSGGGPLKIINSTISGNASLAGPAGGISSGPLTELQNTILAGNTARSAPNCQGSFTSLGNNIIGDLSGCETQLLSSDLTGDPGLDAFVDDGTPGRGHFPLTAGSQAVDSGNSGACPATDQLGQTRVDACDIGAIEFQPEGTELTVSVDFKPGNPNNNVNPKSKGVVNVAILSTETFESSTIDPASVTFGPGQAAPVGKIRVRDVNNDGFPDVVFHFRVENSGIACGDTSASITGETTNGISIQGSDSITTVGCKAGKSK
jgi:hypothetical protein